MQRLSQGSASAAVVAQSGLGTGRQRHREGLVSAGWGRRWQWLRALMKAVAQGGGSSGYGKPGLGCGSRAAESGCAGWARLGYWKQGSAPAGALRRLGRGGDEVNEKPTPPPLSFNKPKKAAEGSIFA